MQRTSSPTARMEPIIRQTSTGVLRAENRIVKGGQVRDADAHPDFAAAQRSNSEVMTPVVAAISRRSQIVFPRTMTATPCVPTINTMGGGSACGDKRSS